MRTYTKKLHARRVGWVVKRLEKGVDCDEVCPKSRGLTLGMGCWGNRWANDACRVCSEFVGLGVGSDCPCNEFGREEAIKVTLQALKRYYREEYKP